MKYEDAVRAIWRPPASPIDAGTPLGTESRDTLKELIRCATLAPSSHNTQCWKFRIDKDSNDLKITILPDLDRRCAVVDPDDHHLYVSLGCALENLCQAAKAYGLVAKVDALSPSTGIPIYLTTTSHHQQTTSNELFDAIPHRQVSRSEYNGEPLSENGLKKLCEAASLGAKGVHVAFLTDPESIHKALNHIQRANTAQVNDKHFVQELVSWIRFGEQECISKGDGLAGPPSGNRFAPRMLMQPLFPFIFRPGPENDKIAKQVSSSAGLAIFVSEKDDPVHWIECGRAYERFALQATALGIKNAMLNQPVESAEARTKLAKEFDLQGRPDLVVRFGKGGPDMPHSLRRSLDDIIVK